MILPFGHPFFKDNGREMVINLVLDKELGYFKKAESLYREVDPQAPETPMYNGTGIQNSMIGTSSSLILKGWDGKSPFLTVLNRKRMNTI